jgi:Flp pilus assembly pilin Flp
MRHRLQRRGGAERGAVAVEFALLAPLLVVLMFGIIDYGAWFSNSIALRQGVREGARQAVVCAWPDKDGNLTTTCDDGAMGDVAQIVRDRTTLLTSSQKYVKVTPLSPLNAPTSTWQRGNSLLVCQMVRSPSFSGLIPIPNNGYQKSVVVMRIERPLPPTLGDPELVRNQPGYEDAPPSGQNWGFCRV